MRRRLAAGLCALACAAGAHAVITGKVAGHPLQERIGGSHPIVACQEDNPCWIPALYGNGQGHIALDAPVVGL